MFRKPTVVYLVISMMMILLTISSVNAEKVNATEQGLLNAANECTITKDYQGAADLLERLLTLYPGTRNEDVYFMLCDIYDNNLSVYAKATVLYQKYLQLFPKGRFYDGFKERLDYLEKNKNNWEIIKNYQFIKRTFYTRTEIENIKMMSSLLNKKPNLSLKSDIYIWLANECSYLNQPGPALDYIEKYFATFPGNGKPGAEKLKAYPLYSEILTKAHQYRKAISVLKEYAGGDQSRIWEYKAKAITINKEWRIWTGFVISVIYIILILMIIIALQPWKEKDFKLFQPKIFLKLVTFCAIFTLIPMLIVMVTGNGIYKTFPTLAILGSSAGVLIRLLAPLSSKISRGFYLSVSFLLTIAIIYISFYMWDTLFIFWTQVRY